MRKLSLACLLLLPASAAAQVRAPFDAPLVVADEYKQIVKTLDLNGDGWMDAFGWWTDSIYGAHPGQGYLHGFLNDGAGNLALAWNVPFTNSVNDAPAVDLSATGDVDGDGDDDMVVVASNQLRVYASNGALPPTLALNVFTPFSGVDCVALADFDGDGVLEVVLAAASYLGIFEFDIANQALVTRTTVVTNFVAEGKLIVADLTGDGELDVLLTGVRVHPVVNGQLQPWAFNFPLPWGYSSDDSRRFDAGDVDGDGDLDLVAFAVNTYTGQARYRIVRRTGPGTWSAEPSRDGGPARMLVDVDGDGDLDGVCCGGGGGSQEPSMNAIPSAFRIALNDGTGMFASAIVIPSVGSRAIAGVVDLDHDGDLDLVGGRCVLYAQEPIATQPSPTIGSGVQDRRTLADLDGDGDVDFEPKLADVRRNPGDGSNAVVPLGLPPAAPGTMREGDPIAGDWDGDGDVDLLARLAGPAGLEFLRNLGSGRFVSEGLVAAPFGLWNFPTTSVDALCEDVDGDGDADLVLRTRSATLAEGNKSAWWSNEPAPGGSIALTWRAGFGGQCIAHVADLDGNGVPDLLAMSDPTATYVYPLSWAPGFGGGNFGAWTAIPNTSVRYARDELAVADLDDDGDLDLAATCTLGQTLRRAYWYENDGLGNLTRIALGGPEVNFGNNDWTTMAAGDVDGDGRTDLVYGPLAVAWGAVAVVRRTADGQGWQAPILQMVHVSATHFALDDPDGDGDLDLLSDRHVRNTSQQGETGGHRMQIHDGVAGQGGIVPLLGAAGPFRVGESAQLRLRGLRPGASGFIVVAYPSDPPPSATFGGMHVPTRMRIHSQIQFTASGAVGGEAGSGSWSLDYLVPGYSAGRTKCYTALVEDADSPSGLARSNRLYVTYGL